MSRFESVVIGLFVGAACPLLTFVACWWSTALLHMHVAQFPLSAVIVSAFTGLATGLLLDALFLRRWIRRFYTASIWIVGACYLGLCVIAVAFFMGLPLGTLALGVAAAVYMARRERWAREERAKAMKNLRRTALVAATVTAMAALPIGILALRERDIIDLLGRLSSLSQSHLQSWPGFTLIGALCVILFLMQYWFSNTVGLGIYGLGDKSAQQEAAD